MSRQIFVAFRRSLGPTPRLERMSVRVNGLELAVWTSPPVERVAPLLLVNGGLLYDHATSASVTGSAIAAQLRREGYDFREQLRALSAPTLVLHGERDALPSAVALELSELLPRARRVLLPDAGHMPFWEAPERFFTLASAFLAAPSTGPPRPRG